MEHSFRVGMSFGLTSGIITTLGLIVGLHSGTHSKLAVIGGILTIAMADAFSDALGIHVSEESEATQSLSKENGETLILRLYEWAHKKWPKYIDCRPIYVEESMKNSGYEVKCKEKMKMLGLPVEMVIGVNRK